ncbi:hypothetical protein NOGI109294_16450 [Nocardiopsis gilva]
MVLLFAVVFHMLCAAGHPAMAAEKMSVTSPSPTAAGVSSTPSPIADRAPDQAHELAEPSVLIAKMAAETDVSGVTILGAHSAGETHECTSATDGGTDQRGAAPSLLSLLLAVGFAVLVVLWASSPPPGQYWITRREHRSRRRNAALLLLTLCIWRV